MRRVFLDANVLFSAAYRDAPGLLALWRLRDVELMTSGYAAEEARRNLDTPERAARLERLLGDLRVVAEPRPVPLPAGVRLPEKDRPILAAAIAAEATHLLTGDLRDFGPLMGRRVAGVLVQTPGEFLRRGR
jgi:uncharacterized protein